MGSGAIVTMRHCRQAKACAAGVRTFLRRHNLDYRKFFKQGLPAEEWEGTGDAMAIKIAARARAEAADLVNGRQER